MNMMERFGAERREEGDFRAQLKALNIEKLKLEEEIADLEDKKDAKTLPLRKIALKLILEDINKLRPSEEEDEFSDAVASTEGHGVIKNIETYRAEEIEKNRDDRKAA